MTVLTFSIEASVLSTPFEVSLDRPWTWCIAQERSENVEGSIAVALPILCICKNIVCIDRTDLTSFIWESRTDFQL